METEAHICGNCGAGVTGKYCGACGQKRQDRISLKSIADDIYDGFIDFESPFLRLLVFLTINPGKVYREYLAGARKRYFSPIKYSLWLMALCAAVGGLLNTPLVPEISPFNSDPEFNEPLKPFTTFANAAIIPIVFVSAVFVAACARWIFSKANYTIVEWYAPALLSLTHMYVLHLFAILLGVYQTAEYSVLSMLISISYMTWGIAEMFQPRRLKHYLYSATVTILGTVGVIFTTGIIAGVFIL